MILAANGNCILEQHQPVHLCNGEMLCFLQGTDIMFKYYLDELQLQVVKTFEVKLYFWEV
jgi:hypothetical protein